MLATGASATLNADRTDAAQHIVGTFRRERGLKRTTRLVQASKMLWVNAEELIVSGVTKQQARLITSPGMTKPLKSSP